jgi:ParB family chromosome partitioning protein
MRAHGFYGHLVARQVDDRYQLAYGERRLRAAQRAGLTELPLAVRNLTDEQMMELAITENVLRKDLNPIEEAEAYQHLVDLGYSLCQISENVGKSPGHISMLLSIIKKEDVSETVRQEKVEIREAHEITKVEDPVKRRELLDRAARGELDREAIKQAVRIVQEEASAPRPEAPSVPAGVPSIEGEVSTGEVTAPPDMSLRLSNIYDPLPNLRAALKRLEKLRPDRFSNIEEHALGDVRALLDEIASRAQYFLKQLGEE